MRSSPLHAAHMETPVSISGFGGAQKKALLSSACRHRAIWAAAAVTVLLPSTHAFAQCAAAPATLSISSGNCADPAFTERESVDAAPVVEVSGSGSYSGVSVNLSAFGSGHGMRATDDGKISLIGTSSDGAVVSTYGEGGHGLYADNGGRITGSYISVYTNGAGAHGLETIRSGNVTLIDGGVNTALDNGHGAYASGGGTITLTRTSVTTSGMGASAVLADAGGSISLNDLSTYSYGDDAPGAVASGADSSLTLNNTYVNVYGNGSAGLLAADGGLITISGGAIASGDYYGGTIIAGSPGMLARGVGSRILVINGATSATYGANSTGLMAESGGSIDFAGYGVFTYQPHSAGAAASGSGSAVDLTDTIVRASGPSSAGLLVTAGGVVTASNTEITTGYGRGGSNLPVLQFPSADIGLEAHGADVVGTGSRLQAENANITTHGDGAVGVRVTQGASAVIVGGSIATNGVDTTVVGGADGVRTTDVGSSVTLSGAKVSTKNINALGLNAMTGGSIAATDARVATEGQNAMGVSARGAGSSITLTRTAVATGGEAAFGVRAGDAGTVQIAGGSAETTGNAAHGVGAVNGGRLAVSGAKVAVSGAGSSAIYLAGGASSAVSITGGSLSAANGAIVLAEGGTGVISISDGAVLNPAVVNGRRLLAQVTDDAGGVASELMLNITDVPSLTGDIVVDASSLAYNLSNSIWTGDQRLIGSGSTTSASLTASRWTGDLVADPGNTADVSLAQGSLWTGLARNAADIAIDASSAWNLTGDSSATGAMTNAGLIQFLARPNAYSTLTIGSYTGGGGSRISFNTYLGGDASPTNVMVINGGQANGATTILVNNTGGPGAQTVGDGIRLVQAVGGGATTTDAFKLDQRVVAGAYEYQLFRGGVAGPNDWFLRSHVESTDPGRPDIPIYRPETPLYAPIPAIARQMAFSTLGTLHERVGDQENLRGSAEPRTYVNGAWGRLFGARLNNRWSGPAEARAEGDLVGFQTGLDLFRRTTGDGGRDHVGLYVGYAELDTSMRGLARGMRDLELGRLQTDGLSVGAYWTHFGPRGWYVDTVLQQSWYDVEATSLYDSGASTEATAYTASLETGYPVKLQQNWLIEPQAQIVYQDVRVDRTQDQYSSVDWDEGSAWTGRIGARLQYTRRDARGRLWQPYGRINLWHAFSGQDGMILGQSSPAIENRFGHTAVEVGGGLTARVSKNLSIYGQASHRWTVDGDRSRQTATEAALGLRMNW